MGGDGSNLSLDWYGNPRDKQVGLLIRPPQAGIC
jgi:hypothetical protein